MKEVFGDRLKCLYSPQHGFVADVQDDMKESKHYIHPYFNLKIWSLYSETRIPTDEMLEGIDHIFVDLQDVGTRVYTYIYTLTLLMEACARKGIEVVVLDRPNPVNGEDIEGNILEEGFTSFVGRHPIPVRHALTIGEVGLMAQKFWGADGQLKVIKAEGWQRWMNYEDTGLPWVIPSPNLPTVEAAFTFIGTVLYEGTNMSEGRGTTRSLEVVGHPKVEPYSFLEHLIPIFKAAKLEGFVLRPVSFIPTFQKHQGTPCGGYQIQVTDRKLFKSWWVSQLLCREFFHHPGQWFSWKQPPYEYEWDRLPIDLINGTDKIRQWVEAKGSVEELDALESQNKEEYLAQRKEILLYD